MLNFIIKNNGKSILAYELIKIFLNKLFLYFFSRKIIIKNI